jgi:hypothetical protein
MEKSKDGLQEGGTIRAVAFGMGRGGPREALEATLAMFGFLHSLSPKQREKPVLAKR